MSRITLPTIFSVLNCSGILNYCLLTTCDQNVSSENLKVKLIFLHVSHLVLEATQLVERKYHAIIVPPYCLSLWLVSKDALVTEKIFVLHDMNGIY